MDNQNNEFNQNNGNVPNLEIQDENVNNNMYATPQNQGQVINVTPEVKEKNTKTVTDYYGGGLKKSYIGLIGNIIWFIIAIINAIYIYPQLKYTALLANEVNATANPNLVTLGIYAYLLISVLWIISSGYKIFKRNALQTIYVIVVLLVLGLFGYRCYVNKSFFDPLSYLTDKIVAKVNIPMFDKGPLKEVNAKLVNYYGLASVAKKVYNEALKDWQSYHVYYTEAENGVTYSRSNRTDCLRSIKTLTLDNYEYTITINNEGKVIYYVINNGEYQYSYTGDDLQEVDINIIKLVKLDDSNKIMIPDCTYNW